MKTTDRKFRLARLWSNRELRRFADLFAGKKIVNVSAGEDVDKEGGYYRDYFSGSDYWLTNYNPGGYRGFQGREREILLDLTEELPEQYVQAFDVVFSHTSLEHIFEVRIAFANLCAMSSDIVIVVVPFSQIQHETSGYEDFWRFTPTCLRRLFQEQGLSIIYEAANNDFNSAVYLFFVASRHPDRWARDVPKWTRLNEVGAWIGDRKIPWKQLLSIMWHRIVNWN